MMFAYLLEAPLIRRRIQKRRAMPAAWNQDCFTSVPDLSFPNTPGQVHACIIAVVNVAKDLA